MRQTIEFRDYAEGEGVEGAKGAKVPAHVVVHTQAVKRPVGTREGLPTGELVISEYVLQVRVADDTHAGGKVIEEWEAIRPDQILDKRSKLCDEWQNRMEVMTIRVTAVEGFQANPHWNSSERE